jgi:hypothetical protein
MVREMPEMFSALTASLRATAPPRDLTVAVLFWPQASLISVSSIHQIGTGPEDTTVVLSTNSFSFVLRIRLVSLLLLLRR